MALVGAYIIIISFIVAFNHLGRFSLALSLFLTHTHTHTHTHIHTHTHTHVHCLCTPSSLSFFCQMLPEDMRRRPGWSDQAASDGELNDNLQQPEPTHLLSDFDIQTSNHHHRRSCFDKHRSGPSCRQCYLRTKHLVGMLIGDRSAAEVAPHSLLKRTCLTGGRILLVVFLLYLIGATILHMCHRMITSARHPGIRHGWSEPFDMYASGSLDRQAYSLVGSKLDAHLDSHPVDPCANAAEVGSTQRHLVLRATVPGQQHRHLLNPQVIPPTQTTDRHGRPELPAMDWVTEVGTHCRYKLIDQEVPRDTLRDGPTDSRSAQEAIHEMLKHPTLGEDHRVPIYQGAGASASTSTRTSTARPTHSIWGVLWQMHCDTQNWISSTTGDIDHATLAVDLGSDAQLPQKRRQRYRSIQVRAYDPVIRAVATTTLSGADALCMQFFADIAEGHWPCGM
jgi:hypothetical protein